MSSRHKTHHHFLTRSVPAFCLVAALLFGMNAFAEPDPTDYMYSAPPSTTAGTPPASSQTGSVASTSGRKKSYDGAMKGCIESVQKDSRGRIRRFDLENCIRQKGFEPPPR